MVSTLAPLVDLASALFMTGLMALGFDPGEHRSLARADGVRAVSRAIHASILFAMTTRRLA